MASLQSQQGQSCSHRATLTPPGESLANYDHSRRRVFIGPMPEKEVSNTDIYSDNRKLTQQIKGWLHSSAGHNEDEESFISVLFHHAYRDFIHHERKEEWGQQAETVVRQGIWQRWQESEWGGSLKHHRKDVTATTQRWVGGSFEVGNVLGVNILDNPTASLPPANHICVNDKSYPPTDDRPFVTSGQSATQEASTSTTNAHVHPSQSSTQEVLSDPSRSSSTAFLSAGAPGHRRFTNGASLEGPQKPILKGKESSAHAGSNKRKASFFIGGPVITPSESRTSSGLDKGKSRSFDPANQGTVNDIPAPPAAVLASGSDVDETSAGVTLERSSSRESFAQEDIILRGQYLSFRHSEATTDAVVRPNARQGQLHKIRVITSPLRRSSESYDSQHQTRGLG